MAITEKDRALIGRESAPFFAPDEVTKPAIRHWCEFVEDANPLYTDEEYARSTKHGGIIAPAQMMMCWCMPRMWPWPEIPWNPMGDLELPGADMWMAVGQTNEFYLSVRPGDILNYTMSLESI